MNEKTGSETTVLGACPHDCPDTCSMLVTVKDGRATAVRGNPTHPLTRGGLCVKVNNYQDRVYSPDRVLYPMRRSGPKGSGQFERVSWDDALAEIKAKWAAIVAEHGPTAILPYSYLGTEGIINGLNVGDPFFNKLGATISERTFCDSGASTAYAMTVGPTAGMDPESFRYSKYIVLWACNTMSTNLHHWPFIAEAQAQGAKVVVIDPVRTRTAKKADWHIAIRPGTDAALALGLMNVIIAEDLVDHDYVDNHTVGYDELKARVADYPPEKVSGITGIPADDVRTLAREFATTEPAVIRIGVAIERHAGGGQTVRAAACLPALTGAWKHVGGGLLQLPIWAFPVDWGTAMRPDFITPGTRVLNQWRLGPALTGEMDLDPPIKSLFVYNSNPAVVAPEQDKLIRGLKRDDLFTVVSEQFMTDTALHADLVLPATTQLEQEDIMFSWGHFYLSYNNQAIEPLGEAVSNTELFRRLAATMGFDDPFFQRGDAEMIAGALDWSAPALEGITLDALQRDGYARLNLPAADEYCPHREGNFPTPSGKVEFVASAAAGGDFVLPLFRQGSEEHQSGTPVDPLPTYIPPNESAATNPGLAKRFPLALMSPKSHAFLNSTYANLPQQLHHAGEQSVQLNPADARERNIGDGMPVVVENERGRFEAVARINEDVMPGVAVAPLGYWRQNTRIQATVQAVNSGAYADLGRAPTFSDNLVQVLPVAASQAAE
ncbi:MAG: molybdopterin-dependent oxidoreductase [Alphaproteobacteria bacterium]